MIDPKFPLFSFFRPKNWRATRHQAQENEVAFVRNRVRILQAFVVLAFAILTAQLWRLQVVEGSRFQVKAEGNRLRLSTTLPTRGIIYDRTGKLLVRNEPSFTAAAVPADIPIDRQPEILATLGEILKIPAEQLHQQVQARRASGFIHTPLALKTDLDQETAFIIEERHWSLPGISVLTEPKRVYLDEGIMPHILGYVGRISANQYEQLGDQGYTLNDKIGKMGVEITHESELRGIPGAQQSEVDVTGRQRQVLASQQSSPGDNLRLTLDWNLQKEMTRILQSTMGASQYAAAIAMNPKNGEILGMVSLPDFDANILNNGTDSDAIQALLDDPRNPLVNYAIGGTSPPGSIFKMITGTGALQEGVANVNTRIVSRGTISVPNQFDPRIRYFFYEWSLGGLGTLDFYRAVALSSDVYFYYLAGGFENFRGLGPDRLAGYARRYGLGELTNIDLPGEAEGSVPDPKWKEENLGEEWLTGDTYNFGIGQGYLHTTPIQMVRALAALANGGEVLEPHVVSQVLDNQGNVVRSYGKVVQRNLDIAPQHLAAFREGMRQVIDSGTATNARIAGISIAGKTGTAEFGTPVNRVYKTHGWFMGFAPANDPEIAIVVFDETGNGALTAAPAATKMIEYYMTHKPAQ